MAEVAVHGASAGTVARMQRLATLVLDRHCRPDRIVASVLERDARETEQHRWQSGVTRDEWLLTMTVRACRELLSQQTPSDAWHQARTAEHEWDEPRHTIDVELMQGVLATPARVDAALAHLPVGDRIAVVLHDALGMSIKDCGRVCRTAEAITRLQLARGRMTLIELLDADTKAVSGTCRVAQDDLLAGRADEHAADVDAHTGRCADCARLRRGLEALGTTLARHRAAERAAAAT